jgi:hypothetical protein
MSDTQNQPIVNPKPEPSEEEKLLAILSYVPILCLLPFMKADRSEFVSNHVRLGMTLFVIEIFALILRFHVIWDGVIFLCLFAALAGIYHVVVGRPFSLPFLSDLFTRK